MEATKDITAITASTACITSLQIADTTGKRHHHIIRDIRSILIQGVGQTNFGLTSYKDRQGKEQPMYNLTKKGALILASGYNALLREKIIDRLEELENERMQKRIGQAEHLLNDTSFLDALADKMNRMAGVEEALLRRELEMERKYNDLLMKMNAILMEQKKDVNNAVWVNVAERKRKRNSPTWKYVPEDFEDIKPGKTIGRVYPSLVVAKMAKAGCGAARFNKALASIGIQRNTGKRGEWVILPPFDTLGIHRQIPLHGYSDYRRMGWTDNGLQFFKVLFGSDMDVIKAVKAVGGDPTLFQSFAKKNDGQNEESAQQVINF